ncbi:MAG: hypothetical protein M1475_03670 [Actinobacteria bacterium]|nr:hypothetical protein [Actinomycetota bacterium]
MIYLKSKRNCIVASYKKSKRNYLNYRAIHPIFKEKIKSLNIEEGKKDVRYEAKTGNNKRIKGKI